jgi:RHS repeat-associated protein
VGVGSKVVRTPDNAGRLDTVAIPGGLLDYDYYPPGTPSGAGKTSDIRGPYGTDLSFTYDGFLTTSTTWSGDVAGSVAWQYNNDFNKTRETVTGQTGSSFAVFGYDNDQLLTCASPVDCAGTSATNALRLTRSPQHGMVTGLALGSTTEMWTYNQFGELARQTATFAPSTPLIDITYDAPGFERDKLGRIVRKTEVIGGVTKVYQYTYDALRRLTDVTVNGVLEEHFEYDANGNRTLGFNATAGTTHVGVYDAQDRLLSYGPWVFTYTANGELESKTNTTTNETWLFQYDVLGNLLSVGLPNGDLVEYIVDGMGRRVGKMKNGVLLKQWIYRNELKPAAELDGAGNLVSQFIFGSRPNVPAYVLRGGNIYRVVSDHLGSPRHVVNVANANDAPFTATHATFGEVSGAGLEWMPFGFAGGIHDSDTGLTRFGARDYDAQVGRWTAKEPMLFGARRTNFYVYVNNDPVNRRDPTGLTDYGIGTDDCSYYGERCEENGGKYYCEMGPEWCEWFPSDPPGEIDDNWALCTRGCLQDCDAATNRAPGQPNASTGVCNGVEAPDNSTPFTSSNNFLCHMGCYLGCGAFALGSMGALY